MFYCHSPPILFGALVKNETRSIKFSPPKKELAFKIVHIAFYYIYDFMQYYETIQFVFCDKLSYCTEGFHIERSI